MFMVRCNYVEHGRLYSIVCNCIPMSSFPYFQADKTNNGFGSQENFWRFPKATNRFFWSWYLHVLNYRIYYRNFNCWADHITQFMLYVTVSLNYFIKWRIHTFISGHGLMRTTLPRRWRMTEESPNNRCPYETTLT